MLFYSYWFKFNLKLKKEIKILVNLLGSTYTSKKEKYYKHKMTNFLFILKKEKRRARIKSVINQDVVSDYGSSIIKTETHFAQINGG